MRNTKNYSEVKLNGLAGGFDRAYKNPLTKTYQYEYALYVTVCELFESVQCRSMCIDRLKLYFRELPHASEHAAEGGNEGMEKKKHLTQEQLLAKMRTMVERDVVGHVTFPMMPICRAEVCVIPEEGGTHTFLFTDGIYRFGVRMNMQKDPGIQIWSDRDGKEASNKV